MESRPEQLLKFSSTFHPQRLQGVGGGPVLIPPGCRADHNKGYVHSTLRLSQVHPVLQLRPQEQQTFLRGPDPSVGPVLGDRWDVQAPALGPIPAPGPSWLYTWPFKFCPTTP